ncbi:carbohydrate ABC transporter permease [Rugosimonospora africana]|uniref:ABC transporter permease n=1 Tax=Rugosimonospora africana TaxID=556532 RepID=A0A8J3R5K8_9ACTN|nr:sugar ABC transporter permease [Rugosimonospora africana]GIH20436.1 ABC transporter permease [Rugosimonospora africana]
MTVAAVGRRAAPEAGTVRRSRSRRRGALTGVVSVLPAVLLVGAFMWYPLVTTVYHSFTRWDGMVTRWVGLANYRRLFADGDIWQYLRTNLVFFLSIPLILVMCLVVAVLLHEQTPGARFFRSVYYLPCMLSVVVVGVLMRSMFLPDGVVNRGLSAAGLHALSTDWLSSTVTAFVVLILTFYWQTLGQGALVFLAGLSAMPPEVIEASQMDGAGWWRRLFRVVLPMQTPAISYFLVINTSYVFIGLFSLIYTITKGGPGTSTTPLDYEIYLSAFQTGDLGYASALSVVLLLLVSVIAWLQVRNFDLFSRNGGR